MNWISVSDRLPNDESDKVITNREQSGHCVAKFCLELQKWVFSRSAISITSDGGSEEIDIEIDIDFWADIPKIKQRDNILLQHAMSEGRL